ncbi:hypothetical protein [Helicobacter pylori]|nr:hypothetical protein [Helicobacter pylori]
MRLVVFFQWLQFMALRGYYYKHAINTNYTITEAVCMCYKKT